MKLQKTVKLETAGLIRSLHSGITTIQHSDYSAPWTIRHQGGLFGPRTIRPLDYFGHWDLVIYTFIVGKIKLSDANHVLVCIICVLECSAVCRTLIRQGSVTYGLVLIGCG